MEALGPGKEFKESRKTAGRASRVWFVCAQIRRFTWGRGCSEASTRWRENKPSLTNCLCVYVTLSTPKPRFFMYVRAWLMFLSAVHYARAALFIWSTHNSSCRGWHCVSGDLTRSFLPRRRVFTLSLLTIRFFVDANETIQSRRNLINVRPVSTSPFR